jgi:hypothetical protein
MNAIELANALDNLFGNPLGPKSYSLVRDAVVLLKEQDERIKELEKFIDIPVLKNE